MTRTNFFEVWHASALTFFVFLGIMAARTYFFFFGFGMGMIQTINLEQPNYPLSNAWIEKSLHGPPNDRIGIKNTGSRYWKSW